jgi:hypothetical protein
MFDKEFHAKFSIGARVCLGVTRTRGANAGIWWSGEGCVASHELPLLKMKMANADMDLTTSHILVAGLKHAASISVSATKASSKFLKGTLVCTDGTSYPSQVAFQ